MKILSLALLALSSVCLGQTSPSIVNNAAAPVRIVSTLSKPSDMLASVNLLNTSSRPISSVTVGVIVTVPQACAATSYRSTERAHPRSVSLDPNASTTLTGLRMSNVGIRRLMTRLGASDIVAQIAVVGVTYADGETWTLTRSGNTYDDDLASRTAQARCGGGGKGV